MIEVTKTEHCLNLVAITHFTIALLGGLYTLLALGYLALGAFMGPDAAGAGAMGAQLMEGLGRVTFGVATRMLPVGLCWFVCFALGGLSLHQRRRRRYCFVPAALMCIAIPFGTAFGIWTMVLLHKSETKRLFEGEVPVPA